LESWKREIFFISSRKFVGFDIKADVDNFMVETTITTELKQVAIERRYEKALDLFFKHVRVEGADPTEKASVFVSMAKQDRSWANLVINDYIRYLKAQAMRGEISVSAVKSNLKPVKLLLESNEVSLDWDKITRKIPKAQDLQEKQSRFGEFRAMLEYSDDRIRPIVVTGISSGIKKILPDLSMSEQVRKIEPKEVRELRSELESIRKIVAQNEKAIDEQRERIDSILAHIPEIIRTAQKLAS
jgi:hypothetical protein